jgi:hypothetical protein
MSLDDPEFRTEICNELNTLIESDRAGAAVLREWAADAPPELAPVLERLSLDQSQCVASLTEEVRRFGAEPSTQMGAFYDKAIAIEPWPQRLTFLNRGQSWILRVVDDLLPDVAEDEALTACLTTVRARHEAAIEAVSKAMG